MQSRLEAEYHVKVQYLGPAKERQQQLKSLNMILTWHGHRGITDEADPRHTELAIEQLQVQDAKIAPTPGNNEECRFIDEHIEHLNETESTRDRVAIARCNHLSPHRPDIIYALK